MKDKATKEKLINEAIAAVNDRWDELETQAFHIFVAEARRELSDAKTKLTKQANANSRLRIEFGRVIFVDEEPD